MLFRSESALNYIGQWVRKNFDGEWYRGRVTRVIAPDADEDNSAELYFQVTYSDGDVEDYTFNELRPLLQAHSKQPVQAAASVPFDEYTTDRYGDDEAPPTETSYINSVIESYQSLILEAHENVLAQATPAAAAASTASQSRHAAPRLGETYNYMKIFKMSPPEKAKHVIAMQGEIDKLLSNNYARWEFLPPGEKIGRAHV